MHTSEVPRRTCGPCTACCTTHAIYELRKPERTPCSFIYEGGCGRYETRPHSCRHYRCAWLLGFGSDEERPDISGRVLDIHVGERVRLSIACIRDGACTEEQAEVIRRQLVREHDLDQLDVVITQPCGTQSFFKRAS